MTEVTRLLHGAAKGDSEAAERLLALVYDELRHIASRKLARESPGHTLQTTALVHEAYMRLLPEAAMTRDTSTGRSDSDWDSRSHFFAAAAEAMRRVLVDNARKKNALKRGGAYRRVQFETLPGDSDDDATDVLALDESLQRLEEHVPDKAVVVKMRYFAGLSLQDTADALGISVPTVHRHWRYARAWLRRELDGIETQTPIGE
ncbi:MAG: sigma-70 family RNA polymerase sigma factor [Planctomycetota bacterium]